MGVPVCVDVSRLNISGFLYSRYLSGPYLQTILNTHLFLAAKFLKQFPKMLSFIFITDYNEVLHTAAIQ
jgi:hypothetical protein